MTQICVIFQYFILCSETHFHFVPTLKAFVHKIVYFPQKFLTMEKIPNTLPVLRDNSHYYSSNKRKSHRLSTNSCWLLTLCISNIKCRSHSLYLSTAYAIFFCSFLPVFHYNTFYIIDNFYCQILFYVIIRCRIDSQIKLYT